MHKETIMAQFNNSQLTLVTTTCEEPSDLRGNVNEALEIEENQCRELNAKNLDQKNIRNSCLDCSKTGNTILDLPANANFNSSGNNKKQPNRKAKLGKLLLNKCCNRKVLLKRIPIFAWLPQYDKSKAVCDLVAGITVGLTVIPQAIAYSNVAGLPPQIGLYSSFMACFVYAIFGSVKDSPIGPTAISALFTRENNHGFGVDGAILLCFISGCVQLVMGFLQLGFLIDFISGPVSIGFTSAAAIIIATTQAKDILGLQIKSEGFLETWENIFQNIGSTKRGDLILGVGCMLVILFLRKSKDYKLTPTDPKHRTSLHQFIDNAQWLISTARNIIVVVFCAFLAYMFEVKQVQPFKLTGYIKPGLPAIKVPPFQTTVGNHTYSFIEMTSTMSSAIIVVPLMGILENIALAKVFAEGKTIDATQEMLSLGACNIISSFASSMPVSGALSRGAVNNASGVKTTFGGIYTGILVILALQFLTPWFSYIPKASLAAVIIAAVIFMVELHVLKPIWRTKKSDLIPATVTFLACLFLKLEIGIAVGIGLNLLSLLYASARPSVNVEKTTTADGMEYLIITPDRSLAFPSVEYVRATVSKAGVKQGSSSIPVVLDARHIQGADFTAAKGIKLLIEDFFNRNQLLLFYNLKPSVVSIFEGVQPKGFKYCCTYAELEENINKFFTESNRRSSV